MKEQSQYQAMFAGVIGKDYQMLELVCPLASEMSRLVGESVANYKQQHSQNLQVVEIGGGTGITTLAMLLTENIHIISIDNEPNMQRQAQQHLHNWYEQGRLTFVNQDALSALQGLPDASADIVASAYTLHNFLDSYREQVMTEIFRVLKPGGQFINGDRYALDDRVAHTLAIQNEVTGYFKVFIAENRLDLLEQWIVHLFSDESENHIMRTCGALEQLTKTGFSNIRLTHRMEVNALVIADKPE